MKKFTLIAFCYGFLAVLLGAFGAHGLKAHVTADSLDIWKTAVTYQMFHCLAMLILSLGRYSADRGINIALTCFTLGVLIFSGSLYLLVLSGIRILGMVTPVGGVLLLAGWLSALVWASRKSFQNQ